jgi:hypothetical protein
MLKIREKYALKERQFKTVKYCNKEKKDKKKKVKKI